MTDVANPGSVSRRVATVAASPKGTRTRQPLLPQRLTSFEKESIVTKRVRSGELVSFLRKETTDQLTPGVERSAAGRFAFLASSGKGLRRSRQSRRALCFERELSGSERDLQGSFRTPESQAKTLGVSD